VTYRFFRFYGFFRFFAFYRLRRVRALWICRENLKNPQNVLNL